MSSKVYRNNKIGEHIRSGEVCCCITGSNYAVVNHHIISNGYSAMGSKAPDFLQMAMTHDLHQELHANGIKSFEQKYAITQKQMVAETMVTLHAHKVVDLYKLDMPSWFWHEVEDLGNE